MEPNEVVIPREVQNIYPSSTKSLTMETEKLLEHVGHPKAKSDSRLDEFQNGNRWVKRLKLSASNYSVQGETAPNHALITPREPTSKLFNGIPRSNTTNSRSNLSYHRNNRSVATEKSRDLSKTEVEDHSSKNSNDKAKAPLVSHAWIQRWLHSGGRETKRESSKLSVEKVEKEHLPSIAAMALMSKVLTCFQECELQKRGSYTVWNTKTV